MGMTERQRLDRDIDAFLRVYKKGSWGCAGDVAPEEVDQLRAIVQRLIVLKYERDDDGESPVCFTVKARRLLSSG